MNRNETAFIEWWEETGQHIPQNNLDLARDAWEAAVDSTELVQRLKHYEKALEEIRSGICTDMLGNTSMSREDMQSVAEKALIEILQHPRTKETGDIARKALSSIPKTP